MKAKGLAEKLQGRRATRGLDLPLSLVGEDGKPETCRVELRVLSAGETADVLRLAREFSVARGVKDPKPGEEIYDYAKDLYTALFTVRDPDDGQPFFASVEEMLSDELVGRDGILMIAEQAHQFQDEVSPSLSKLTVEEMGAFVEVMAGDGSDAAVFFCSLRPGLRLSCVRSMAAQLWNSQGSRSPSGPSSNGDTTSASGSAPKSKPSPRRGEP